MIVENRHRPSELESLCDELEAILIGQGFRERFDPLIGGTNRALRHGSVEVVCLPIDLDEPRVGIVDVIDPLDRECQNAPIERDLSLGNRIEVGVYVPVVRLTRTKLFAHFNRFFAKCRSEGIKYLRQRKDILVRSQWDLNHAISQILFLAEMGEEIWKDTPESLRSRTPKIKKLKATG